jgi:hypothetical protein
MAHVMGHPPRKDGGGRVASFPLRCVVFFNFWFLLLAGINLYWSILLIGAGGICISILVYQCNHTYYSRLLPPPIKHPRHSPLKIDYVITSGIDKPWWICNLMLSLFGLSLVLCVMLYTPWVTPVLSYQVQDTIDVLMATPHTLTRPISPQWIFDTGCGRHMSRDVENFINLTTIKRE